MKSLTAEKVKDCWVVRTTDTRFVFSESDVHKLIRQNGLKERSKIYREKDGKETDEVIKIYAD